MEAEGDQVRKKLVQSIERSSQLLTANKHYQFAQKVKMLAQRKTQTQKHLQAQILLRLGIEKMFSQSNIQFNAIHDLITALLDLYISQKSLWSEGKEHQIYQMLTIKDNPKTIQYFLRIVKNIAPLEECPEIGQFIISFFQKKQLFYQAECYVVHLDLSRATKFLERWHEKVDNQQYQVIVCRMALLKGYHYDFDESMVLLSQIQGHNSFVKFTKFLIQTVQMKSRECYQKIGASYKKFIDSDGFFRDVYESYGIKYFNKDRKGDSGILGILKN